MALRPTPPQKKSKSPLSKGKPAAKPASSPMPAAARPASSNNKGLIIAVLVMVAIVGIIYTFATIDKSNKDQLNAIAANHERVVKMNAESAAKAEQQKREVEARKAAKERRAAEEAAMQQQMMQQQQGLTGTTGDTPDTTGTMKEQAPTGYIPAQDDSSTDDTADDTTSTEEPAEETTSTGGDEDTDATAGDEEDGADGDDLAKNDGKPNLKAAGAEIKTNKACVEAMVAQALEEGTLIGLCEDLKNALVEAGFMEGDTPATEGEEASAPKKDSKKGKPEPEGPTIVKAIRNAPVAETARAYYLAVSLAMENADDAAPEKNEAFLKWLLTDKQKPATAFVQGLDKNKIVEQADASSMMDELMNVYLTEPKRAYSKIREITSPLANRVNKKLYPIPQKEITSRISTILSIKKRGNYSQEQQDGVNLTNVYRLICGLPTNVVYNAEYEKEAQEAAEACKKAGHIAHDLGHNTNKCNLFAGMGGPPATTVSGYIQDNGGNNREARGHRAWILHPGTGKTAFGKVEGYQAMRTLDSSGVARPTTGWSYPGRGFFPLAYLHGTGWSYYMPAGVNIESPQSVKVEMWSVSKRLKTPPPSSKLNSATAIPIKAVFAHKGGPIPTGNSVIFEPDYDKMKHKKGQLDGAYWIRITMPGFKDEYVVDFF